MGFEVEDLEEITSMEEKIDSYLRQYHPDKIDLYKQLTQESYNNYPDWVSLSHCKIALAKLGLNPPQLLQELNNIENKMTKINEEVQGLDPEDLKLSQIKTNMNQHSSVVKMAETPTIQLIKAKLDNFGFSLGNIQEHLKQIAENTAIQKEINIRLTSILETLLARMESVGKVVAHSAPSPVPANAIPPMQPSQATTAPVATPIATGAQPPFNLGAVTPNPPFNPVPVTQPYATNMQNGNKPPAERLPMDGSAEHGIADPNKKWAFVNIIATPLEFTKADPNVDGFTGFKALKATFLYTDKNNMQKESWDSRYNQKEVWIAKKLISPQCIVQRLQMQQQIQVPNWWADKNSKPIGT